MTLSTFEMDDSICCTWTEPIVVESSLVSSVTRLTNREYWLVIAKPKAISMMSWAKRLKLKPSPPWALESGLDTKPRNRDGGKSPKQVRAHPDECANVAGEQALYAAKDLVEDIRRRCLHGLCLLFFSLRFNSYGNRIGVCSGRLTLLVKLMA